MDTETESGEVVDWEMEEEDEGKGDGLECDYSAYTLFHAGQTGAPCLSFDILRDSLGDNRTCDTPATCYFAAGTQAARTHVNNLMLLKVRNLRKIKQDESDEEESDEELEEESELPVVEAALIKHNGCVNRLRVTSLNEVPIAATWSELGEVSIWDLSRAADAVNDKAALEAFNRTADSEKPLFTFKGHSNEGFALDWSQAMPGTLASGDCAANIHIWKPNEGGTWQIDTRPYTGHSASVEDIQWSPNEPHVFSSCSVDKSIRVWDDRVAPSEACMLTAANAHSSDINVIHWNHNEPFLVSGGDDGKVFIWDLRQFQQGKPVAALEYHNGPVTTVEWHPADSSVLASADDNQILQWDLAVERDADNEDGKNSEEGLPHQLLFVHKGQQEIKELHWHAQIPGLVISTSHTGFNIFKTIST
ncbi:glutamate-rich WD repeat-containing protein 1-like [Oratosquilla oratoria]|uniref:glutamate-rich WD repeat-containing protein 1-like n=1 Tax=Oratosquilla oratoria TaxID=337810 RepID=UPI003F76C473